MAMVKHFTRKNFDDFIKAYVACALWLSNDDRAEEISGIETFLDENYNFSHLDFKCLLDILRDCHDFLDSKEVCEAIECRDYAQAGHDFFLTRNGHGCGFWEVSDSDWTEESSKVLDNRVNEKFGEIIFYVDDEKIYCD